MDNLVGRLATVAGPSRSLDREIALAVGWQHFPASRYSEHADLWIAPSGARGAEPPPSYTFSIDVALTLASDGDGFSLERRWNREGVIWIAVLSMGGVPLNPLRHFIGEGKTAPLAICIAALEASALSMGKKR